MTTTNRVDRARVTDDAPARRYPGNRHSETRNKLLWRRTRSLGLHALALALAVAFAVPFLWLVMTSLSEGSDAWAMPPELWPDPWVLGNYEAALRAAPFDQYLANTLTIALPSIVGVLASSVLPAYGFARIRSRLRDPLFFLCLSTMMIPYAVLIVPQFVMFRSLGWVGTYLPLVVPQFFGSAYFIFLLRQFFLTIPTELTDAAKVDGCSELAILVRIILPLSTPVLTVVALFQFLNVWGDFFGPLVYVTRDSHYTVALGLAHFLNAQGGSVDQWVQLMAVSALTTLPSIALFFFAERTFVKGITLTGLKG